jgi:photosystem II stability/assembly factor-like uncharacterized protein
MKTQTLLFFLLINLGLPLFSQHYWQILESGTIKNLNSVGFITAETGIAVGDAGTIIYTTNGGVAWLPVALGVSSDLHGVAFASNERVFAVGEMGTVLLSVNQGQSWQQITIPNVEYDLLDVSFDIASGRGVITGQTNAIIVTSDFGETWTVVNDGYMSTFYGASMVNANMGIVVGWNSIFQPLLGYTLDWQTWDYQNFYPTWGGVFYEGVARAAKFTDENHGFVVGTYFVPGGGFLAPFGGWSNNAWEASDFPEPLTCIDFINSFGVIAGDNAYLAESQDGGLSWETISLNIGSSQLNDIKLIGNTGFIVGGGGIILKLISTVSVDETEIDGWKINCFPNPATNEIHVSIPFTDQAFTVSLYDISGSGKMEVKSKKENGLVTIIVDDLPRGIYTLVVENKESRFCGKVVLMGSN